MKPATRTRPGAWVAGIGACIALCLSAAARAQDSSADEAHLWKALAKGSHVAMVRHALAPGVSDPEGFTLDDCTTQRNLSDEGREQARRLGARFREAGIDVAEVMSSQWCRCRETADLLDLGSVSDLPALNSLHGRPERAAPQTAALKDWLSARKREGALVLVTHQVNIRALTGAGAASGEMVVLRLVDGEQVEVLGRILVPY